MHAPRSSGRAARNTHIYTGQATMDVRLFLAGPNNDGIDVLQA